MTVQLNGNLPCSNVEKSIVIQFSARVRATYVTEDQTESPDFRLSRNFLSYAVDPPADDVDEDFAPFFTVSPETVLPCLMEDDVFKIDSVRAQDPAAKSKLEHVPESIRARVIGGKDTRARFRGSTWERKIPRNCASCGARRQDLSVCSR